MSPPMTLPDPTSALAGALLPPLLLLIYRLLEAIYSRRWQIFDSAFGTSVYKLLDARYEAAPVGVVTVQPDVYDGSGSDSDDDDDDHSHSHDHDHGPRDIVVVSQRWALVTGASRGIGQAFVRHLSDLGFSLLLVDLDDTELDELVARTSKRLERGWRGGVWRKTMEMPTVVKIGCDVNDVAGGVARCEEAVAALPPGSLKLLVNNVGVSTHSPSLLGQHSAADIDRILRVNLQFTVQLTRALWPHLARACQEEEKEESGGSRRSGILFLSSCAALIPAAYVSVYAATKAALIAFARATRAEAAGLRLNMDVLAIAPGYVNAGHTPLWLGAPSALAEPDDVARASLLLLPTARSAMMTPSIADGLTQAVTQLLPEGMLGRLVFERHASQRERQKKSE